MIIEERVERSQYVKLITWIVSFIILMAGIVFPVLILWVNQDMMSKVIGASVLCLYLFYFDFYCCLSTTETYLVRNAYNYGTYIGAGVYLLFRYN